MRGWERWKVEASVINLTEPFQCQAHMIHRWWPISSSLEYKSTAKPTQMCKPQILVWIPGIAFLVFFYCSDIKNRSFKRMIPWMHKEPRNSNSWTGWWSAGSWFPFSPSILGTLHFKILVSISSKLKPFVSGTTNITNRSDSNAIAPKRTKRLSGPSTSCTTMISNAAWKSV